MVRAMSQFSTLCAIAIGTAPWVVNVFILRHRIEELKRNCNEYREALGRCRRGVAESRTMIAYSGDYGYVSEATLVRIGAKTNG